MTSAAHSTLVIGGGGVTGIAWATGLLLGVERAGIDLRGADRLVGTSAGSAVTAQLTGPMSLEELYERQVHGIVAEIPGSLGRMGVARIALPLLIRRDESKALRSIGDSPRPGEPSTPPRAARSSNSA